jgi:Uma2 family endonuclease
MAAFPLERDIDYPESDGRPLGETDFHREEIVDLIYTLRRRYEDDPNVYVAGNLFLYYARGNRSAVVCPDVFLIRGVPKKSRRTYKLWEEKVSPSLVIEVTSSESTQDEDLVDKMRKYALLEIEEYFLFDPLDEYLEPRLQGYRLAEGRYRPISPEADGSLLSRVTALRLRAENERLRFVDATTGEPLLRMREAEEAAVAARRAAEIRAESSEARAAAAEEELARLRLALEKQL